MNNITILLFHMIKRDALDMVSYITATILYLSVILYYEIPLYSICMQKKQKDAGNVTLTCGKAFSIDFMHTWMHSHCTFH